MAKDLKPKEKHKVRVVLDLDSMDAEALQTNFANRRVADHIEIKRELAIMHEVMDEKGTCLNDKINNTLQRWSRESTETTYVKETKETNNRYKLRYR